MITRADTALGCSNPGGHSWRSEVLTSDPPKYQERCKHCFEVRRRACGEFVCWWDGEYEGNCELPEGHEGDHWDGMSWFNDENECTDWEHVDDDGHPTGP